MHGQGIILTEGWSFSDRKRDVEKQLGNGKNPDICRNLLIIGDALFGPSNLDRDALALAETLKGELSKVFCTLSDSKPRHIPTNDLSE